MSSSNASLANRWRVNNSYSALGYSFRIKTNSEEIGGALDRLLFGFRTHGAGRTPSYAIVEGRRQKAPFIIYGRRRCLHRAGSAGAAIDYVLWDANTKAVESTEDRIVLHAAAAAWRGRGIVFPAPPDSGKTTLVAGLTRAGLDYLTDEAALIDPATALVHPFPRALWMDAHSVDAIPNLRRDLQNELLGFAGRIFHVPPDVLRPGSVGKPCPVRYVVAPAYENGTRTALEPMTRAAGVSLLVQNSFNFSQFGGSGLAVLGRVIQEAECFRLRIGDLSSAVHIIEGLVGSRNGHGRS